VCRAAWLCVFVGAIAAHALCGGHRFIADGGRPRLLGLSPTVIGDFATSADFVTLSDFVTAVFVTDFVTSGSAGFVTAVAANLASRIRRRPSYLLMSAGSCLCSLNAPSTSLTPQIAAPP